MKLLLSLMLHNGNAHRFAFFPRTSAKGFLQ
jgi:hypothetical protein